MIDEQENLRTPEEEFLDIPSASEDFDSPQYSIFLDRLFTIGHIPDETFTVCKDLTVTLRLLSAAENLEIAKKADACPGFASREVVTKLEVLCRAIVRVNGQYLRFSEAMLTEWQELTRAKVNEKPTDAEQQRSIIKFRIPPVVIDEIYKKYQELLKKQEDVLIDLKKN